jgi:hypothetical protein
MTTITFDTLNFVQRLESTGIQRGTSRNYYARYY